MTGTDLTIYKLHESYKDIESKFGVRALTISSRRPSQGQAIQILSGFWNRGWSCEIESFVDELRETPWIWKDSIRYSSSCNTQPGTSGSPIVEKGTRIMVGINNTSNRIGRVCEKDNPCEFESATAKITASRGRAYGQETYLITTCLNQNRSIDLSVPGCLLPH